MGWCRGLVALVFVCFAACVLSVTYCFPTSWCHWKAIIYDCGCSWIFYHLWMRLLLDIFYASLLYYICNRKPADLDMCGWPLHLLVWSLTAFLITRFVDYNLKVYITSMRTVFISNCINYLHLTGSRVKICAHLVKTFFDSIFPLQ